MNNSELKSIYSYSNKSKGQSPENVETKEFSSSVISGICEKSIRRFIERIVTSDPRDAVSTNEANINELISGVRKASSGENAIFSQDCRREFQDTNTDLWRKLDIFRQLNEINSKREEIPIDLLNTISDFLNEKGEDELVWSGLELNYVKNALLVSRDNQRAKRVQQNLEENQEIKNGGATILKNELLKPEPNDNKEKVMSIVDYIRNEIDRRIKKRVSENPIGQTTWKNQTETETQITDKIKINNSSKSNSKTNSNNNTGVLDTLLQSFTTGTQTQTKEAFKFDILSHYVTLSLIIVVVFIVLLFLF